MDVLAPQVTEAIERDAGSQDADVNDVGLEPTIGILGALPDAEAPPPWVYIMITDRQNNESVVSNPVR